MTFINEKIRIACEHLKANINASSVKVPGVEFTPSPYKETNVPPTDAVWMPYGGEELPATPDYHAWFRFTLEVPEAAEGREYRLVATTGREGQWDATNPQCTVFIDGETAYQAFDTNHTWAPLKAGTHAVNFYYYTNASGGG